MLGGGSQVGCLELAADVWKTVLALCSDRWPRAGWGTGGAARGKSRCPGPHPLSPQPADCPLTRPSGQRLWGGTGLHATGTGREQRSLDPAPPFTQKTHLLGTPPVISSPHHQGNALPASAETPSLDLPPWWFHLLRLRGASPSSSRSEAAPGTKQAASPRDTCLGRPWLPAASLRSKPQVPACFS